MILMLSVPGFGFQAPAAYDSSVRRHRDELYQVRPMEQPTQSVPHLETRAEEWVSSITHAIGVALAAAALSTLVILAHRAGDARRIVTLSIYGASLILLYLASTCYHACHPVKNPRLKHWFRIWDHAAIYALIAGTYTPFLLVMVRGAWGWSLFGVVWAITAIGTSIKLFYVDRYEKLSVAMYVLMGWVGFIAIKPFLENIPGGALAWIGVGGLAYTTGIIFYFWDRLPFNHAIWHLFVLAGSACHFLAMLYCVAPIKA
jgi:hemolysin III